MVDKNPNGIEETRHCHCLAARKRARELTRRYEVALRPHGLRATQFSVLSALAQTGPIPLSRLAGILGLERTTLTRVASVMGRNGWIEIRRNENDMRLQTLVVAEAGLKKLRLAFPHWKRIQNEIDEELKTKSN